MRILETHPTRKPRPLIDDALHRARAASSASVIRTATQTRRNPILKSESPLRAPPALCGQDAGRRWSRHSDTCGSGRLKRRGPGTFVLRLANRQIHSLTTRATSAASSHSPAGRPSTAVRPFTTMGRSMSTRVFHHRVDPLRVGEGLAGVVGLVDLLALADEVSQR